MSRPVLLTLQRAEKRAGAARAAESPDARSASNPARSPQTPPTIRHGRDSGKRALARLALPKRAAAARVLSVRAPNAAGAPATPPLGGKVRSPPLSGAVPVV